MRTTPCLASNIKAVKACVAIGISIGYFCGTSNANPNTTSQNSNVGSSTPVTVEMHKLDIPEIKGAINVPSTWSIVTFFEALEAAKNTVYVNQEAQEIALQAAEGIGSHSFKVSKNIEPYNGLNYALTIAWSPITNPSEVNSIPIEARSEVSKRMIEKQMLPKIKSLSRDFSIIEEPTQIDNKGSGAWITYKEKVIKKGGRNTSELEGFLITRLYLLEKPNYFVIITLSFPENDDSNSSKIDKDILGEMLTSFQIQNN